MKIRSVVFGILVLISVRITCQVQLSIEDCVVGAATYLRPSDLEQLQWRPATSNYTYVEDSKILLVSSNSRQKQQLIDLGQLNTLLSEQGIIAFTRFPDYYWIAEDKMLFTNDTVVVRYNTEAQHVYKTVRLEDSAKNIDFSPGYDHIAYTVDNNLLLVDSAGNKHEISINQNEGFVSGQTVHRNEFGISKGIYWSPHGNALAYYIKDETDVTEYPLVDVTERVASLHNIRYPMAGMESEKVKVGIYYPENRLSVLLDTGEPDDHYLTNIAWSPDEQYVYIVEINRDQNHLKLNQYDAKKGTYFATVFEEKDLKYINPLNPIVFLPDTPDQFIWQSRKDGYNHMYLYASDGDELKQLTSGEWEVLHFEGFSSSGQAVYFTATKDGAMNEMLYKLNMTDGSIITVTPEHGIHSISLNISEDLIMDRFSSTTVPNTIQIREGNGQSVRQVLEAGNTLTEYKLADVEEGKLLAADGKTELHYRLFKPRNMVSGKKYPVIIYVYNGPFVQLVRNTWVNRTELWLHYMADNGYAGFIVDGRGSANRGKEFEQVIFRSLGSHEMEDQLKGVDFLKSLDFVDPDRLGVFGWSYGGFMTSSLMTTYPDVFKAGVAGGPVTDWKYYEVMYGERYMDTPDTNPEGYANTSVLNKVQNLKGNLLVIHGAMDPIVVWQHSLMLLKKCVEKGVLIDYFVYPSHEHNVFGTDRVHLMQKVTDYFIRNL